MKNEYFTTIKKSILWACVFTICVMWIAYAATSVNSIQDTAESWSALNASWVNDVNTRLKTNARYPVLVSELNPAYHELCVAEWDQTVGAPPCVSACDSWCQNTKWAMWWTATQWVWAHRNPSGEAIINCLCFG